MAATAKRTGNSPKQSSRTTTGRSKAAKEANKSVRFTLVQADQSLLQAVEQELANEQYASFGDLCKQALQQFLSPSDSAGSEQLEQQLTELQGRVAAFETLLTQRDDQRLSQVETQLTTLSQHLAALAQQVEQVGVSLNQPLAELQNRVGELEQTLSSQVVELLNQREFPSPSSDQRTRQHLSAVQPEVLGQSDDPVLQRLSLALEDF